MKNISYGLPYLGSKSKIAEEIINILPTAKYFVDLFGGGGALSHCASYKFSDKYEKIIYNEMNTDVFNIFKDFCLGKIKKFDWFSHEDYKKIRYTNNICFESLILFSMYNNFNCGYLINKKDYELYKKFYYLMFYNNDYNLSKDLHIELNEFNEFKNEFIKLNDFLERYYLLKNFLNRYKKCSKIHIFERFKRYLNINKTLKNKNIEFYNLSYENVTIPEDSVVICDPPYKDTIDYRCYFNHERFYDWCRNNRNMVFINEYSMPDDFYLVKEIKIHSIYHERIERLYCNKVYEDYGINDLF